MKISGIKHIILCLTAFNLVLFSAHSQTIEQTIKYADSLLCTQNYDLAIKEYKRIIFFQDTVIDDVILNFADAYFFKKDFDNALKLYNEYISNSADSVKLTEVKFKIINCHIQKSDFHSAQIELFSFKNLKSEQEQLMNFYIGVCYYSFDNYVSSKEYFIKSIDSLNTEKILSVENLFNEIEKSKQKKPKLAVAISLILPGSGQIYCGEYKSAASAFLLNACVLFVGYKISAEYKPVDALIAVYPYFQRYYLGTAKNAYLTSIEKNEEFKSEKFVELMEILEK